MGYDEAYDEFYKSISALASQINDLVEHGIKAWTPIVDNMINNKIIDINKIEWTLDRVMDFAVNDKGLALFEKLREYYATIDLEAANDYWKFYQEYFGDEPEDDKQFTL